MNLRTTLGEFLVLLPLSLSGTAYSQTDTVDHLDTILVPEAHLRIIYPTGGMYGEYDVADRSVPGNIVTARVQVSLGGVTLGGFDVTNYNSVNALAKRFRNHEGEWDVSGDADEGLETGRVYVVRKREFEKRKTGRYFNEFVTINGRTFGNRLGRSASGGVYYC